MSGAIWWIFIAQGIALAISTRWLTIKHSPKKCDLCPQLGRHRIPRRKPTFRPMPALCCYHMDAYSASKRRRFPAPRPVTHPHRWHFTRLITRGTT